MGTFPTSTYRLQFNARFSFRDATYIVKYLRALGISHVYASPIFKAKKASLHGYDVLDHSKLHPELGTEQEFDSFIKELKESGLGLILDIVPNHMHAVDCSNPWWADVLENGPGAPHAGYFDIDWHPPKPELENKVLLPLLDQPYGDALDSKSIAIAFKAGSFFLEINGLTLPTDPRSWSMILQEVIAADDPELKSINTAIAHLPEALDTDTEKVSERQREKEVIKKRLDALIEKNQAIKSALYEALITINSNVDALEAFLKAQCYRLCFWRVANDEINYRRFFDVVSLAGIRTEKTEVFEAIHTLVFQLIKEGKVEGCRIDHIDGLWDPEEYLRQFRMHCKDDFYVIGEKIVIGNEKVRVNWPFQGTVGYDFLNQVNGLYVVQSSRKALQDTYFSFTNSSSKISEHIYQSKKLILEASMASELNILSRHLALISEQHRSSRDFTAASLKTALRDVIAFFPVYRSYIKPACIEKDDIDYVSQAINRAKRYNALTSPSIFDFIKDVLLLKHPANLTDEEIKERESFVMRFQQHTGPVMAKGIEDTALYRYYPLTSLNDVGYDLHTFGSSVDSFHEKNSDRLSTFPYSLLATSTHDTKRSEDVRARINVLSELPDEWRDSLFRWHELNQKFKTRDGDEYAPDNNEEYLFYQTIVGTWPLYPMDPQAHVQYVRRIIQYMQKALKEAKINTSWINPNTAYEEKVKKFIEEVLKSENTFLQDFTKVIPKIIRAGLLNSLSQLLLKMTSPGVPDIYQGNELWDFSLVDPDNRRMVDFENRIYLLKRLTEDLSQMVQKPEDGRIKLFFTTKLLQLRQKETDLFVKGAYVPIKVVGDRQNHVISFAWILQKRVYVIIATRFFTPLLQNEIVDAPVWQNTQLLLPDEIEYSSFQDLFSDEVLQAENRAINLQQALKIMPFSVLEGK